MNNQEPLNLRLVSGSNEISQIYYDLDMSFAVVNYCRLPASKSSHEINRFDASDKQISNKKKHDPIRYWCQMIKLRLPASIAPRANRSEPEFRTIQAGWKFPSTRAPCHHKTNSGSSWKPFNPSEYLIRR